MAQKRNSRSSVISVEDGCRCSAQNAPEIVSGGGVVDVADVASEESAAATLEQDKQMEEKQNDYVERSPEVAAVTNEQTKYVSENDTVVPNDDVESEIAPAVPNDETKTGSEEQEGEGENKEGFMEFMYESIRSQPLVLLVIILVLIGGILLLEFTIFGSRSEVRNVQSVVPVNEEFYTPPVQQYQPVTRPTPSPVTQVPTITNPPAEPYEPDEEEIVLEDDNDTVPTTPYDGDGFYNERRVDDNFEGRGMAGGNKSFKLSGSIF